MVYTGVAASQRKYTSGNDVRISDAVKALLSEGEIVVSKLARPKKNAASKIGGMGGPDWYATNKRLLVQRSKSDVRSLDYSKISFEIKSAWGTKIALIFLALISILCFVLGALVFVGPTIGGVYYGGPFIYSLLFWAIGLEFIAIVFVWWNYKGYYQIVHPNLQGGEQKKWRIMRFGWGEENVDKFIDSAQKMAQKIADVRKVS
jgi:hypothetical protein